MTIEIKDKFDTDAAEHLVIIGYPENKKYLPDLVFWSCFPNDPVCWITYPYINSLKDEILAEAMAVFMKFNLGIGQEDMVETACAFFIFEERCDLIPMIISLADCQKVREWFASQAQ
ncbi:MAG: hypothetical protein KKE30_14990 [Gammaproteobacteria bacterium]|nr:hypothetical protein [Gammaproteobacteria bacterium]MBU1554548.1 hypothetical protein [Gammaproteobacteria bacterium]MBU2072233.1 hypothetical protein [Gammaproteobacteria bacterium]MBU2182095.1 hypothetical protein [Gammaproteobacteria bacterium]MBU2205543.1 hypothetical protein [Gammaproteobacteria bacterium]